MAESPVKRAYTSPVRTARVAKSRETIRRAAERLFLRRGFLETSMDDIAAAAKVSRATVFNQFGSKVALLREILDVKLTGSESRAALADDPIVKEMWTEHDPVRLVRLTARLTARMTSRANDLYAMAEAAAVVEPEIGRMLAVDAQARLTEGGTIVDVLAHLGALRSERSPTKAKEALWLLTSSGPYRLAHDLGWSVDEYERWLGDCMIELLLAPERRSS